jgi:hypothetical protein
MLCIAGLGSPSAWASVFTVSSLSLKTIQKPAKPLSPSRVTVSFGARRVKAHRSAEPYFRERSVYERLSRIGVHELLGFNVPQSIAFDDELRVIEMTIVARPFVLDFAGAYFDIPPDFPEETWAEWEIEKREQFEERWPTVQTVLAALEGFDIHMVDVSPQQYRIF